MFTHSIAEFFAHILYSFTRNVAKHYNFNEDENLSDLFGYTKRSGGHRQGVVLSTCR